MTDKVNAYIQQLLSSGEKLTQRQLSIIRALRLDNPVTIDRSNQEIAVYGVYRKPVHNLDHIFE